MGNGKDRDFEQALGACRNGWERQRVLTAQAYKLFEKREFDCAAVIYAKTTRSFEEKLKSLSSEEKTQKTVLCSWIVELFLDKFNVLKGSTQDVDAHANVLFELKQFLPDQKSYLDPATTFNLISSQEDQMNSCFMLLLLRTMKK
ncbi:hypothetical protein PsorP6_000712 [Peronosclerospora sorghi]|uniref:Uncharacterized protein n=1 Tax=Peronosclerospora sorghi TaxID=230839 RepID=A0ACC0WT63_9STRA|nr:hypothetical protein PsorP6_000712 [Peronosclerospora sorghi]